MSKDIEIIFSINRTEYRFSFKPIHHSLDYAVRIEFLSKDNSWVSLFLDQQLSHFMGERQFQNKDIPEQILKVENELSNSIKLLRSKTTLTHN